MTERKNTLKPPRFIPPLPTEPLSPRGKTVVLAGGALVIAGFALLSFADPSGRDPFALVSPLLLIGGYAAIGAGLFLPL